MTDFLKIFLDKLTTIPKKFVITSTIIILLFSLAIFPYIDTNLFYPNRIKNRLEILDMATKLDLEKIEKNIKLKNEYNSILTEINKSNDNYINNFLKIKDKENAIWKFISGALIWIVLAVVILFNNDRNNLQTKKQKFLNNIGGFLILLFIGSFIGLIFSVIPTIGNPWINYISAPILTIVILALLFYTTGKK